MTGKLVFLEKNVLWIGPRVIAFDWFSLNYFKVNPGKFQLLLTSREETSIRIEETTIKNSSSKKLLGVLIDNKLTFNYYVSKLCKEVSQEIHALVRASNCMSKEKLRILMNTLFTSQFVYCPLIWMFHS